MIYLLIIKYVKFFNIIEINRIQNLYILKLK